MNHTDQHIQKLLVQTEKEYTLNSALEDTIMDKINSQKKSPMSLAKAKRNAKIGLIASIVLLGVYGCVAYYELFNATRYREYSLEAFYPSIFTSMVVVVVYFQLIYSMVLFKKIKHYHR